MRRTLRRVERVIARRTRETLVVVGPDGSILLTRTGTHDQVAFHDVPDDVVRGAYLTHNHPAGTSFSIQDVRVLFHYRLAEMRVVTPRGQYVLELPDDQFDGVDELIDWTYRRMRREGHIAINAGEIDPEAHEAEVLRQLWSEIADIRGWRYRREERR